MRTTKRHVFVLDHGDDIVIEYRGAEIQIVTSSLDAEEADMLEVRIPAGHAISGLTQRRAGNPDLSLSFADKLDLKEEIHGHLSFVTFGL